MKYKASAWVPLLLGLALSLSLAAPVSAAAPSVSLPADSTSGAIQTFEDALYATRYEGETPDDRISRLETTVFGQPQTNLSLDARIAKLKAVLSSSSLSPLSPSGTASAKPPSNQTSARPTTIGSRTASPINPASKAGTTPTARTVQPTADPMEQSQPAPDETDYPAVTLMEKQLFAKTFEREDITQRLLRLEKEVFKVPQSGALADRVDHLRTVVLGDTADGDLSSVAGGQQQPAAPYSPPPIQWTPPSNAPMPGYGTPPGSFSTYSSAQTSSSGPLAYGTPSPAPYGTGRIPTSGGGALSPDMMTAMSEVEKEVLGHAYPSEPVAARLDRLENKVFNATSPELSPEDRMQRVIAVASAGGAPQSTQARVKSTFQALLPIILTILPMLLL
jgi:hypothetical protein